MNRTITQICILFLVIALAVPAFAGRVIAELEYFYADDGTLIGKAFNGKRVNFEYDLRGQLLAVKDAQGKDLERYTYDPAGNRLSKTINSVTTTYTYDKANQLVTSTVNGVTTHYKYDAAGRMIQAGDKKYIYNGQNKVVAVWQNGDIIAKFEYNIDGQIAKAIYGDKVEEFMWDGLALIWRSGVTYINEPYVTGGNPVMAGDDVLFNDMLGSTLAVNGKAVEMTSFGETADKNAFFTGKPMIDELGYSFLFRDYNPNQGKWTTSDPLGYPDGWNNLAYCNNGVTTAIDFLGMWATGVAYPVAELPATVATDTLMANRAYQYFLDRNAPLSAGLVYRIMTSTSEKLSDVTISKEYTDRIQNDSGFSKVINYIHKQMSSAQIGETVSFNNAPVDTILTSDYDLAHSIHGVIFKITGSITKSDNWEGTLTITYSDPYDFRRDDNDWRVRIFGRLYHYGWISKFNVNGKFTINVKE